MAPGRGPIMARGSRLARACALELEGDGRQHRLVRLVQSGVRGPALDVDDARQPKLQALVDGGREARVEVVEGVAEVVHLPDRAAEVAEGGGVGDLPGDRLARAEGAVGGAV